jgi:signal transduction histidine kinase
VFNKESSTYNRLFKAVAVWIVMNAAVWHQDKFEVFTSNVFFISVFLLLHLYHNALEKSDHIEGLYDELSRKHYELEQARKEVTEYARKVQDYAQIEERNRISKDIHDELGHKLIRLKMMMEAALLIGTTQPQKSMELMEQVRNQLGESMDTLRNTLRRLAPSEERIKVYSMQKLIEQLGSGDGIEITYETLGNPQMVYPSLEVVLYRNAQEAVTNAIRHGHANRVHIQVRYGLNTVEMDVSNNGKIPAYIERKGLGLRGMEERASMLGGKVTVEFSDQFHVITTLPFQTTADGNKGVDVS